MSVPQLAMRRRDEDAPPVVELPFPYVLRAFIPGDEAAVATCLALSFEDPTWDATRVLSELVDHPLSWKMWVVAADNEAVATATARKTDQPNVGYVHFVATHPDHRGRRLGSAVTVAVLREFEARGATEAMLTTDDYRLAAIKTYLRLGFQPDCTHESHPERWREVFSSLSEEGFMKEERTH